MQNRVNQGGKGFEIDDLQVQTLSLKNMDASSSIDDILSGTVPTFGNIHILKITTVQ